MLPGVGLSKSPPKWIWRRCVRWLLNQQIRLSKGEIRAHWQFILHLGWTSPKFLAGHRGCGTL